MFEANGVKYYRFKEACDVMGVSESFLHKQRRENAIKSTQRGRCIWISSEQIEEFFKKFEVKKSTTYIVKAKTGGNK